MRIITRLMAISLILGSSGTLAQPVNPEPAVSAPDSVARPEAPSPIETPPPVVEESGLAAELRRVIDLFNSDPTQAAPNSTVEQELVRLAASADAPPEVFYNLGVFYLRINDLEKAYERFQQTLAKAPDFADAIAQLGVLAAARGQIDEAKALIDKAINIDKYCAPARNYLSEEALREGRLDDVIRNCRIALLGDPDNLNAYLNMAIALFRKGQYDVAKLVCQSALSIDQDNSPILNLMGLIHLKENDVKAAIMRFQAAIQADPGNLDARKNLASVTLNFKDYEMAVKQFEEVLNREPENEEFQVSYAVALRGMERYDEAKNVLVKVLARNGGNREARYNYCILLHEYLQDYKAALEACTEFQRMIDKKHSKWKEMVLRIKGIRETIQAIEEMKKLQESAPAPAEEKPVPGDDMPPPADEKQESAPAPAEEKPVPGDDMPPPADEKSEPAAPVGITGEVDVRGEGNTVTRPLNPL